MSAPTMRQLRSWQRRLQTAHIKVADIAREAAAIFGDEDEKTILIFDRTIELRFAMNGVEAMIDERTGKACPEAGGGR